MQVWHLAALCSSGQSYMCVCVHPKQLSLQLSDHTYARWTVAVSRFATHVSSTLPLLGHNQGWTGYVMHLGCARMPLSGARGLGLATPQQQHGSGCLPLACAPWAWHAHKPASPAAGATEHRTLVPRAMCKHQMASAPTHWFQPHSVPYPGASFYHVV